MLTHTIIAVSVIAVAFASLRGMIRSLNAPLIIRVIKTRLYLQYSGNTQSR